MSRALNQAAKLKAEIRLAQAVSEFEAGLQDDAKREFSLFKNQTISSPPTIKGVMQLTAEIDHTTRTAGSRCYGPRLMKTLECVQQFAAIGDVIIGGSQNIVACGVWTIVRTTLLAIVRFQAYFESLSELFLSIGKSAPRYGEMAALTPKSQALQDLVSEYFIVVVNLCRHMYTSSLKSKFGQLKIAMGKPDIGSYQKELERWSAAIREQFGLEEAISNAKSRNILQKLSSTENYRGKLALRQKVLDGCTRFSHHIGWKIARNAGSTSWFLNAPEYRRWRQEEKSSMLLRVAGKLGSGKTVLLANMVQDVLLQPKAPVVAFFFSRVDDAESLTASTIIGSLTRQLIESMPMDTDNSAMRTILANSNNQDMAFSLQRLLPLFSRVFFILDGLDDCPLSERKKIFSILSRFLADKRNGILSVCISYRLEAESRVQAELAAYQHSEVLFMPEENKEIDDFIQAKLEASLESGNLTLGDPALILRIRDVLQKGARGMFLWATLQIDSICSKKTDESIHAALDDLPMDLPATYRRILHQRKNLAPDYQERVLKLMLVVMRPLSLDELREAISVVPLQTTWDPRKLVNDARSVLSCCGSLVFVDEEQLTAHFIHPSVQQFLLNDREDPNEFHFSKEAAELNMARVILTYLNYNVFQTQVSKTVVPNIPAGDAPARIVTAALRTSSHASINIALRLLRMRKHGDLDIGQTISDYSGQFQAQGQRQFHFYLYAHHYWIQHTKGLSSDNMSEIGLLRHVLSPSMRFSSPEKHHWLSGNTPGLAAAIYEQRKFPDTRGAARALARDHLGLFHCNLRSRRHAIQGVVNMMRWLRKCSPDQIRYADFSIGMRIRLIQLSGLYRDHNCSRLLLEPNFTAEEYTLLLQPIGDAKTDSYRIAVKGMGRLGLPDVTNMWESGSDMMQCANA
ncbi:hypothetical protein PG985_003614 [Apiospora marii]|uniref:uncharacterized protein n=1 Tax=Apiospora marii TaxID=335849 RepID=UPI00312DB194